MPRQAQAVHAAGSAWSVICHVSATTTPPCRARGPAGTIGIVSQPTLAQTGEKSDCWQGTMCAVLAAHALTTRHVRCAGSSTCHHTSTCPHHPPCTLCAPTQAGHKCLGALLLHHLVWQAGSGRKGPEPPLHKSKQHKSAITYAAPRPHICTRQIAHPSPRLQTVSLLRMLEWDFSVRNLSVSRLCALISSYQPATPMESIKCCKHEAIPVQTCIHCQHTRHA